MKVDNSHLIEAASLQVPKNWFVHPQASVKLYPPHAMVAVMRPHIEGAVEYYETVWVLVRDGASLQRLPLPAKLLKPVDEDLRTRVIETLKRYNGTTDSAGLMKAMGIPAGGRRTYAIRLSRLANELGEPYVRRSTIDRAYMGRHIRPWVWGMKERV